MAIIGITGHRGLDEQVSAEVTAQLRELLAAVDPAKLTGVSCLADGADSMFADEVLDCGGRLEVIIPAEQYREHLPADHHRLYDDLLARAECTHRLDYTESTPEAHMAASRLMLTLISELIAVWDGQPARSFGGTADVVAEARAQGIPVRVIWPAGARR